MDYCTNNVLCEENLKLSKPFSVLADHFSFYCLNFILNELWLFYILFVGMNFLVWNQSLHYCQGYVFHGTGETNRGYPLLMTANKTETALYRAPTFSLLLVSHGGISSYMHVCVCVCVRACMCVYVSFIYLSFSLSFL